MRVLLVTWTDNLLQKLQILSPQLEYCAIVVDELEPAQKILERVKLPKSLLRPLYELKECVRDFYYDYVICIEDGWWTTELLNQAKRYGAPQDKLLLFNALTSGTNFLVERSLRYFREHADEFEMFATGISLTAVGMDVTQFKRKCFNFGRTGQDLYYNFQVAKHAVAYGGGYITICADNSAGLRVPIRQLKNFQQPISHVAVPYRVQRPAQFFRARRGLSQSLPQRILVDAVAA